MRDWDPDFEQIVLLYKPLSKCPRQQRVCLASKSTCAPCEREICLAINDGDGVHGMPGANGFVCMIRWPNGRSEPFGYNIGGSS